MLECTIPDGELWLRYRSEGDLSARDRLIANYAPWARAVAASIHRRVPAYAVDREDFIQNATMGLMEAVSRYDPSRGVEFRAYAATRVRGAVFNGIRNIVGNRPTNSISQRLHSRAQELADSDDQDPLDFLLDSVGMLATGYFLDEALAVSGLGRQSDVFTWVHAAQMRDRLAAAIVELPERTRRIIELHYFSGVRFSEIAGDLGITRGRVSQIHHDALDKLKDSLRVM